MSTTYTCCVCSRARDSVCICSMQLDKYSDLYLTYTRKKEKRKKRRKKKRKKSSTETGVLFSDGCHLMEFMYLVFTRGVPVESYHRRLRFLLMCLCDFFRALINSLNNTNPNGNL